MKEIKVAIGILCGFSLLSGTAFAEPKTEGLGETPPPQVAPSAQASAGNSLQANLQELAALGGGVHKVKTEGKRLKSCVIVGEARISTVLGVSKGLSVARRNAQLNAEGTFVSWLKTHVSSVRSSGDETVIELTGVDEAREETGMSVESSSEQITSAAQGAIRGMTLIGEYRDAETKMLYRVFAWKPGFAEMAADAEQSMNPVVEPSPSAPQGGQYAPSAPRGQNPGFDSRTLVSPEAAEFL